MTIERGRLLIYPGFDFSSGGFIPETNVISVGDAIDLQRGKDIRYDNVSDEDVLDQFIVIHSACYID